MNNGYIQGYILNSFIKTFFLFLHILPLFLLLVFSLFLSYF